MGQQLLIYSSVARGTLILAEDTEFTGNFSSIASQYLQKLPESNNKFTYNCDNHTFNYLVDDGYRKKLMVEECISLDDQPEVCGVCQKKVKVVLPNDPSSQEVAANSLGGTYVSSSQKSQHEM